MISKKEKANLRKEFCEICRYDNNCPIKKFLNYLSNIKQLINSEDINND